MYSMKPLENLYMVLRRKKRSEKQKQQFSIPDKKRINLVDVRLNQIKNTYAIQFLPKQLFGTRNRLTHPVI